MKRWFYLMVAVAFLAGGILSIALAQPDKVTIDNKYPKKLKGPVVLTHKLHASAAACTECHHEWKKEERPAPQKCATCHKADDTGEKGLKRVYHKNCQDCHKNLENQGKKTGPTTKCSGCHPSTTKTLGPS
jgi:hypothetical protein